MVKTQKLPLQTVEEDMLPFATANLFFQEELAPYVQNKVQLENSFLPSVANKVVPNHFPFVFWKVQYLFDQKLWKIAEERMPILFRSILRDLSAIVYNDDTSVIDAIINYCLWRGHFSWLQTLGSLYSQSEENHTDLFQVLSLYSARKKMFPLATFYHRKVKNPTVYYELCYQILTKVPPKISQITYHKENIYAQLLSALQRGDKESEKNIVKTLNQSPTQEDQLIKQYQILLARGSIFQAARLILIYEKNQENTSPYITNLVLQLYIQNQKLYAFLIRIIKSRNWPGEKTWYEIEYCLAQLNMASIKGTVWFRILENKRSDITKPSQKEQNKFLQLIATGLSDQAPLPRIYSVLYKDLILNHYVLSPISQTNMLRRRFLLYANLLQEPIGKGEEIDIVKIASYSTSLIWTYYQYQKAINLTPFIEIAENLSGHNLALRAFLGIYYFKSPTHALSRQYLQKLHLPHPLIQTLQVSHLLENDEFEQASEIHTRLLHRYPNDPALQLNHKMIHKMIMEQK